MDGTLEKRVDTVGAITDVICRSLKFGVKQRAALRHAVEFAMDSDLYEEKGFHRNQCNQTV